MLDSQRENHLRLARTTTPNDRGLLLHFLRKLAIGAVVRLLPSTLRYMLYSQLFFASLLDFRPHFLLHEVLLA